MSLNQCVEKYLIFISIGLVISIFLFTSSHLISPGTASEIITLLGYYQSAKLMAGDWGEGDSFGRSIAIFGDIAIIGAPYDDDFGMDSGSAYVFLYDPLEGSWDQVAKLNASDAGPSHLFGMSVAINGNTAFVGAPAHSPGGLVYVFERDQGGTDAWGEVGQIQGDEVTWGDYFGISMDLSEDRLIVGAYAGGDYDGTVYIFERDQGGPGVWGQVARLVPADNPAYNYFGYSVAISGDIATGGAPGYDGIKGAAYIFERQANGSWLEMAQLTPEDRDYHDYFGLAVDIDGDVFAAGSPWNEDTGALYIYERDQGGPEAWGQSAKLLASDGAPGDGFGQDVLVSQDLVFAGATGSAGGNGAIYIYELEPGGSWDEVLKLTSDEPEPGEGLGNSLALDDFTLLAGAPGSAPGGAAYVYNAYSPPMEINLTLEPERVSEGAEAVLKGSFSDPDPEEAHSLNVGWGDGSTTTMTLPLETQVFTLTHTYLDDLPSGTPNDIYTLTVTITDAHQGIAWANLPLVVENVAPSVYEEVDLYHQPGDSMLRWGSFSDPGADTWIANVDYGDGGSAIPLMLYGQNFRLEHIYPYPGTYQVNVMVTDDDNGEGTSQFLVYVVDPWHWHYLSLVQR